MSPKAKLPLGSHSAKKSISRLLTFYDRSGRQCIKHYGAPALIKEASLKQWTRRHIIGLLTAHWQCMTTAQKAVYEDEVKTKNLMMSGYNYFFKLAMADLYTHHGLAGYWSMNEVTGEQVPDYSGNANHGTLKPSYPANCPFRVASFSKEYGNALSFDGDDDYVNLENGLIAPLNTSNKFTIELWAKPTVLQGDTITLGTQTPSAARIYAGLHGSKTWAIGIGSLPWVGSGVVMTTEWTHLVIKVDKATQIAKLYKNADLIQTRTGWTWTNSTTAPFIGAFNISGSAILPFNGLIDEVRIYNRALSEPEILKHYNLLRLDKQRQLPLLH